ncbi:MAG: enoyl-CoA hydratase/isomerase family protein [Planctomycetes bacterium]|nr:enoyl-CoA hydratase/isomerase family protein [Planctomycetota bacterium]
MAPFAEIRYEPPGADGVAVLTLARPEKRNAIGLRMVEEMHAALALLERDPAAGALVLAGEGGKVFAGGADIAELRDRTPADAERAINQALFTRIENLPLVTVAAVAGWALGGGCELALACDLRVAGASARFGQPETGLGILPGAGGTQRLPRIVGLGRAKELILTGRIVDAAEAERIGLANRVVPDDAVLSAARELAALAASKGRAAQALAKAALNAGTRSGASAGMALEVASQGVLFESGDKRARMTAFLEKGGKPAKGQPPAAR